jgi:DNA repair exonuclease SbcCD ATPase subunit
MFRFLVLVLLLAVGAGSGIYYSREYWLPGVLDTHGNLQIEAFKAIAAAFGVAVAALVTAGGSILNVGLQLRAGKSLEETKRRLAGELEEDKSRFTKELEDHKNKLAFEESERERLLVKLDQEKQIASDYRYGIDLLRRGRHATDEIEDLQKKIAGICSGLDRTTDQYKAWIALAQRGLHLHELAAKANTPEDWWEIWYRKPKDADAAFGTDFATSAERVLELIRRERMEIIARAAGERAGAQSSLTLPGQSETLP